MIKEVHEYLDSLYIIESLAGNEGLEKYKFIRKSDRVDYSSLTACYDNYTTKNFTMKWKPFFTVVYESDLTISFIGNFGKWDVPFEKNFNLYAKKHKGYKSIKDVQHTSRKEFLFNFANIETFKNFFEMYFWRDHVDSFK